MMMSIETEAMMSTNECIKLFTAMTVAVLLSAIWGWLMGLLCRGSAIGAVACHWALRGSRK